MFYVLYILLPQILSHYKLKEHIPFVSFISEGFDVLTGQICSMIEESLTGWS